MRRLVLIAMTLLATALLTGCAAERVWYHPTKDMQAFTVDRYECQRDARMVPPTPVYPPYTPLPPSYTASRIGPSMYALDPTPQTTVAQATGNMSNSLMYLSGAVMDAEVRQRVLDDCLRARGYHLGTERAATAPPADPPPVAPAASSAPPQAPRRLTPAETSRDAYALKCAQMPALCR